MAQTVTKRNVNFAAVTFAIVGGATITLTGVVDIKRSVGGKLLKFKGDNDLFDTTIVPDGGEPSVVVTTADLVDLLSLPMGTTGSFSYTHLDARNRTVGGAGSITYTAALAIVEDVSDGGTHAQFGMGQIKILGISDNGQDNPFAAVVGTGS